MLVIITLINFSRRLSLFPKVYKVICSLYNPCSRSKYNRYEGMKKYVKIGFQDDPNLKYVMAISRHPAAVHQQKQHTRDPKYTLCR